jgi:OOP family OmpA-OmpF porin
MDWRALQSTRAHHAAAAVLEGLNFRFDSAEIEQRYETDLDFVARLLLDNPEVSLTLAGHTDLVGTAAYNDVLADRRADSVLNALVERGVPAERLTTTGFGESVPTEMILGPSITNRRVEVIPSLSLP